MPQFDLTIDNVKKCLCHKCPVQKGVTCVREKMDIVIEMMGKKKPYIMPAEGDIPGVYCIIGAATCEGLDVSQSCICDGCRVWLENKLDEGQPSGYFCRYGISKK